METKKKIRRNKTKERNVEKGRSDLEQIES